MAVLVWKHGTSKAEAARAVRAALDRAGHGGAVTWSGTRLKARVGPFGSVVSLEGEVTDEYVVIDRCGGLAGGRVLAKCRDSLAGLFPGGEVSLARSPAILPANG